MRKIPLEQQIDEVAREISLRAAVYPRLVFNGKLAQSHAAEQLARMRAALGTLKRLRRKPAGVRRTTTRRRP
jgi:hypothetical protein